MVESNKGRKLQHVDETINQFLFAKGGKCIFHHFFHSAQGCFLLRGVASTHLATQEASSTAPPSTPPPFSLGLLLTRPWWKLLTGQGSMEQCGEVIVHTAFPLLFLLSAPLPLPPSTVILNTQPNIAGETRCPLFLNLHGHRVTIFPDTRVVKMRKTWPFFSWASVCHRQGCHGKENVMAGWLQNTLYQHKSHVKM